MNGNINPISLEAQHEKNKAAGWSVVAAVFLTVTKLAVGLATGSLGIISEAAHSALDMAAAVVTAVAVKLSGRPADSDHQFGHGKVENFSALFEAVLLMGTCAWIIYEATHRLATKDYAVEANYWSFGVLVLSILINVNRTQNLYRVAKKYKSQALEADALHFSSDIASSTVVVIGLFFVRLGYPIGDPIAALGVAILVLWASCKLAKQTIDALLDTAPKGVADQVAKAAQEIEGVIGCSQARVRQSGAHTFADLCIQVPNDMHMGEVDVILHRVEVAIQSILPGADVTIRPEVIGCSNG